MPLVTYDDATWGQLYRGSKICSPTYGAVWGPCQFLGGVAHVASHGLVVGDKVIFRNSTGHVAQNHDYRVTAVPNADSFTINQLWIEDQSCEWSRTRIGEPIQYGRDWGYMAWRPQDHNITLFDERWARLTSDTLYDLADNPYPNPYPHFTLTPASRVLVIGCGYGGLIEAAHDAGFPLVYGIEDSSFVLQDVRADVIIVPIDFTTSGVGQPRNQVKNATGQTAFDLVITEDVAPGFSDSDVQAGSNVAAGWLDHGIDHLMTVNMVTEAPIGISLPFNQKALEDWKALIPDQTWISIRLGSWRVL